MTHRARSFLSSFCSERRCKTDKETIDTFRSDLSGAMTKSRSRTELVPKSDGFVPNLAKIDENFTTLLLKKPKKFPIHVTFSAFPHRSKVVLFDYPPKLLILERQVSSGMIHHRHRSNHGQQHTYQGKAMPKANSRRPFSSHHITSCNIRAAERKNQINTTPHPL